MDPKLEEVFKMNGVPTYTFVRPQEFTQLLVALRTPGRGVVIEGPSGIGKTSAVENALAELGIKDGVAKLSARRREDVEYIEALPEMGRVGVVVVDDFHRLSDPTKSRLADYMKTLADESSENVKIVIIGINRAGENLIRFANDLVNRIEVISFEANADDKVNELLVKGEEALGISINVREEIVQEVRGSFYLAQLLGHEVCVMSGVTERPTEARQLTVSLPAVVASVWARLGRNYRERCSVFCLGTRSRTDGRAPYLHILRWLAESNDWTLSLRDAMRTHSELRGSVGQVVDKGFLGGLIDKSDELRAVLHFDQDSVQLTVEDPQFLFYIRNMPWQTFSQDIGFRNIDVSRRYDFALSFAGANRDIAQALFDRFQEHEVEVFYDKNEQHRILAEDVEQYLLPIYQSEARFVIALLGPEYPKRVWTRFEAKAFKDRFAEGAVIPVWFTTAEVGMFDESARVGGYSFDPYHEVGPQLDELVDTCMRKLNDG